MIEEGTKVSIEYTLTLDDGSVADTNVGESPLVYEHGSGQILPALESELATMSVDDTKKVDLTPEQGYGVSNPEASAEVTPDQVPEEARVVGTRLVARDPSGAQTPVQVVEVHDDRIVLDLNHPLADENLHFDVKIVAVG